MRDFLSSPDWLVEFLCLKVLFSLLGRGFYSKWWCYVFSPGEGVSHFTLDRIQEEDQVLQERYSATLSMSSLSCLCGVQEKRSAKKQLELRGRHGMEI